MNVRVHRTSYTRDGVDQSNIIRISFCCHLYCRFVCARERVGEWVAVRTNNSRNIRWRERWRWHQGRWQGAHIPRRHSLLLLLLSCILSLLNGDVGQLPSTDPSHTCLFSVASPLLIHSLSPALRQMVSIPISVSSLPSICYYCATPAQSVCWSATSDVEIRKIFIFIQFFISSRMRPSRKETATL